MKGWYLFLAAVSLFTHVSHAQMNGRPVTFQNLLQMQMDASIQPAEYLLFQRKFIFMSRIPLLPMAMNITTISRQ
ncbi:hypothetical protein D3C87_499040 [compost metagenome]